MKTSVHVFLMTAAILAAFTFNSIAKDKGGGGGGRGGAQEGQAAPDFTLKGLDGQEVTLSSFKGKPLFLIFGSYT